MIEIIVGQNLEKAMRVLKRKLIREGVFKELKARRFYEKPSERRKRKEKEAHKKRRKEQERAKRFNP
jgi:small subunit ribosomal protein S21